MKDSPATTTQRPRRKGGFLRLPMADRKREVTIRIVHRGGEASWWLIKARGETEVFSGVMALEDVMARVLSEK